MYCNTVVVTSLLRQEIAVSIILSTYCIHYKNMYIYMYIITVIGW
jgi:hypothetical protein